MKKRYWFRAKRYGWGWGLPGTWQGWVVLVAFLVAAPLGAVFLLGSGVGAFILYEAVITAVLLAVCFRKGEPPRWRWGGD